MNKDLSTLCAFKWWGQESCLQMFHFNMFYETLKPLASSWEVICGVTEVNRSTCLSVDLSHLGGCAVCDCQVVKKERSLPSSSPLFCWSGSSEESQGGETQTCGRWWRPRDPRWGSGRRSGRLSGSLCRHKMGEWRWWSLQSEEKEGGGYLKIKNI